MNSDTKKYFEDLDSDMIKAAKKNEKKKKEKYQGLEEGTEHKMDSKFAKKVLKSIKSKSLRESFEHDKVLIDNRKFWTKD